MSLYLSHPDVSAVKIGAYPKRHPQGPSSQPSASQINRTRPVSSEVCYADFFVTEPARLQQSA